MSLITQCVRYLFILTMTMLWSVSVLAQAQEGQVISSALFIAKNRSVALPGGEWRIKKVGQLPGSGIAREGYLLENQNPIAPIPYLLVTYRWVRESMVKYYWEDPFYGIGKRAFALDRHGSTDSALQSKISYLAPINIDESAAYSAQPAQDLAALGLNLSSLKDIKNGQIILAVARVIQVKEHIRVAALVRLPNGATAESLARDAAGKPSKLLQNLTDWNAASVTSLKLSFFDKKQQPINELKMDTQPAAPLLQVVETFDAIDHKLIIQQPKEKPIVLPHRRALVIGNSKYKFVNELKNPRADASLVAETLEALGFKVTLKNDLNLKEMNATLRSFKASVQKGDEVVFYYAGHGVQIAQSNLLLPVDIVGESEDQIRDDAVFLDRIMEDFSDRKARFMLAVVDACRDNPFKRQFYRTVKMRGLTTPNTANGQMIIFSAGIGQQALDNLGPQDKDSNGVFTRVFAKEIQKPGLGINLVVRNVRKDVVALAKMVKHDQVPAIYDQMIGEFYFKP